MLGSDIFKRPAFAPLVLSPELGHDVIDCLTVGIFRKSLNRSQTCLLDIHFVLYSTKHTLVVDEDFVRETLEDPFVLERLQCCHSIHRVPIQAQVYEVEEF